MFLQERHLLYSRISLTSLRGAERMGSAVDMVQRERWELVWNDARMHCVQFKQTSNTPEGLITLAYIKYQSRPVISYRV